MSDGMNGKEAFVEVVRLLVVAGVIVASLHYWATCLAGTR